MIGVYFTFVNEKIRLKKFLTRYWIRTREIRFKSCLKGICDSIYNEDVDRELNSNSLERHQVLKLTTVLRNPEISRATIDKVLRAFENVIQMELIGVRWEEIKKLQKTYPLSLF